MGKRVLICDDNVDFLKVVADMLRTHGYEPIMAKTGSQAVEKARKLSPDLVLLDYRLPDLDGTMALRELRQTDERLPIIVMTGFGHERLAAEVIKLGAMDYLAKPFKGGELLESVANALRKIEELKQKEELEKFVFWGKLFPLVAHEIRTPLHSIGGALTLIRNRHQNDKTTARALEIIHEEIVRLNEFVNQCLDFSRPPAKEGLVSFDLNEAVNSSLQLMTPSFKGEAKKIEIEARLADSLPAIHGNPYEIKQVLINLLRNAAEACPKEGRIMIETLYRKGPSDEFAEIRVTDNGVGIGANEIGNIFTPFFSKKQGGTGLGLAICKKLVEENHHGEIRVSSSSSQGTTLTVRLPVAAQKEPRQEVSLR